MEAGREPAERRLPGTRFADQPEGLPDSDLEGHPVHGVNHLLLTTRDRVGQGLGQREMLDEVDRLQEHVVHGRVATSSLK